MGGEEGRELKRQRDGLSESANAPQKGSQRATQVRASEASRALEVMVLEATAAEAPAAPDVRGGVMPRLTGEWPAPMASTSIDDL